MRSDTSDMKTRAGNTPSVSHNATEINTTMTLKERSSFERTALPHLDLLYGHALKLTKSPDDAHDLVQETYLRAYRFWDKFEEGTNIRGWLYQIMKNSHINNYRKRSTEPNMVEFDETLFSPPGSDDPTVRSVHDAERTPRELFEDAVAASLESLPRDFRTVIMMSDVEELTYEEMAGEIDVPIGTVRSRLHRGRKVLRSKLQNYARRNRYII